jgi:uncharacterized protein (TIGR02246 family)
MRRLLVGMIATLMAANVVSAQTQGPTTVPSASSTEGLAQAKHEIDKGNAQWVEGWAKGDAALVAALFADDGVQLVGSGKLIKGRQQILERLKVAMQGNDPGVKATVSTVNVWLDGTTAYETGKYKYEYTKEGKPGTEEGRYVTIWRRQQDGSWKIVMDMGVPQN